MSSAIADRAPLVISLAGDYDIGRSHELIEQLSPAYDAPNVIVDFTAVTYADSSCLNMLIRMRARREANQFDPGTLVIQNPRLRKIFAVTGLDRIWPIVSTLGEALEASTTKI